MKKRTVYYFIMLLCFINIAKIGYGQTARPEAIFSKEKTYISLDMLDSLYGVQRYTLNTFELYGVDEIIEVYNVVAGGLVVLSILPDFKSESNWTAIELTDIQDQLLDEREFNSIGYSPKFKFRMSNTKSLDFKLVKKEKGQHWVSNVCLTELFFPSDYTADIHPSIFNVQQGTLNVMQTPIRIVQMMNVFGQSDGLMKDWAFPLDFRKGGMTILPNRQTLEREYLSQAFDIQGELAYQFWTLTDWSAFSGYEYHRGVDRFVYMPGKGIVGGSYDFYFRYEEEGGWEFLQTKHPLRPRHNKTTEELWQNVIEEKVMLAEELNNDHSG